ncbi:hypothetical protein CMI39_00055 [Candidatus Pacearchaeota archaeon]|jgi:hypothetical protein|nr:hypothetical protein [Candidatus Pacearchaeota archaeon]|tara:strand:+ start:2680 stop:3090 length:411 start_codon:yes stop_codon:yes gene_type:complete
MKEIINSLKSNILGSVERLRKYAMDSCYFEDLLSEAMMSLYKSLPNGKENYGSDKKIGWLYLNRFNDSENRNVCVEYCPSEKMIEEVNYLQSIIGTIVLEKKEFHREGNNPLPRTLEEDTKKVMDMLGLKYISNSL